MAVFLAKLEAPRAGSRQVRGKGVSGLKKNDLHRALRRRAAVSTNFFPNVKGCPLFHYSSRL
jgi:hypothetical protein